jgi:hypothetical protein
MLYSLLFHSNNGYVNMPQCYIYAYIACLVSIENTQQFGSLSPFNIWHLHFTCGKNLSCTPLKHSPLSYQNGYLNFSTWFMKNVYLNRNR